MIATLALLLAAAQTAAPPDRASPYQNIEACIWRPGAKSIETIPARTRTVNRGGKFSVEGLVLVNGHPTPYGLVSAEAQSKPWSIANAPIVFNKKTFVKYGLPRVLGPGDVVPVGAKDRVVIAAEAGNSAPQVIYLLHSGLECSFQPYRLTP